MICGLPTRAFGAHCLGFVAPHPLRGASLLSAWQGARVNYGAGEAGLPQGTPTGVTRCMEAL